jgi:hypothetical protein
VGSGIGYRNTSLKLGGGASARFCQIKNVILVYQSSILKSWLNDELPILYENILARSGGLFKLAVSGESCQSSEGWREGTKAYPNPPTSCSIVQISVLKPLEKSSE